MEIRRVIKKRLFIGFIFVIFLMFVGSIVLSLLRSNDPYMYFTGMGDSFDISPDEKHYLFSYYIEGDEGIYRSKTDGTDVKKIIESFSERYHHPRYSHDGTKILYLGKNKEGINKLYLADSNGSGQRSLTTGKTHVTEAVFSATGEDIFFIGMPAVDFKKAEGETTEGFDLSQINGQ